MGVRGSTLHRERERVRESKTNIYYMFIEREIYIYIYKYYIYNIIVSKNSINPTRSWVRPSLDNDLFFRSKMIRHHTDVSTHLASFKLAPPSQKRHPVDGKNPAVPRTI